MPCCFWASFPCVSVHRSISPMTKDEEHSMCQNSICVIFNMSLFLLLLLFPKVDWLCAWGYFCVCWWSKHVQHWITVKLVTVGVILTENCTALPSPWLAGHLYFADSLTLGGTSFLLGVPCFYLRKEPCKILHRQCMWSMLCCYENEHQKVYIMLFYYVFAFGVELSNFHQNLPRALHCHDNWGFTSLSTLMICRLLVVFLYLFLNILCGIFSGICLFKFGLVFLKWWSYF